MSYWFRNGVSSGRDCLAYSLDGTTWKWGRGRFEDILKGNYETVISEINANPLPDSDTETVQLKPAFLKSSRVFCIGKNYASHAAEMGSTAPIAPDVFTRSVSSFVTCGEDMIKPFESNDYDYEGELAVIIGKKGRRITKEQALEHIAGLAIANDGTIRDWQKRTSQFTLGKNFDKSGSFSSFMRAFDPNDSFGIQNLSLKTQLNGQIMQNGNTSNMIFDVVTLIETVSAVTELKVGDVILTGTPEGVGVARSPKIFMKAGDNLSVQIENIGSLENSVVEG